MVEFLCKPLIHKPFCHSLGPVGPPVLLLDASDGLRELLVFLVLVILMALPEVIGAGTQSKLFKTSFERDSKSSTFANRS